MNTEDQIKITEDFVRTGMTGFDSGHDWWHLVRVRNLALYINEQEGLADPFIIEMAALLHEMADAKFSKDGGTRAISVIGDFLAKNEMSGIRNHLLELIRNVSFSNKKPEGNTEDPVLLVLQDADRLDAIGAIGIARAFNYGGFRNRAIYNPGEDSPEKSLSTIAHFYDKLLKLKDLMNTATGKGIAEERHLFLLKYLEQFYREWNFALPVTGK